MPIFLGMLCPEDEDLPERQSHFVSSSKKHVTNLIPIIRCAIIAGAPQRHNRPSFVRPLLSYWCTGGNTGHAAITSYRTYWNFRPQPSSPP